MLGIPYRQEATRRTGFTLIEILVVVAIVAMLATVGAIQLTRARITVREQLALMNLRSVAKACQFFFVINNVYPPNLVELGPTVSNPPYLDDVLAKDPATRQGYVFNYNQPGGPTTFALNVNPQTPGVTGIRYFYVDQNMVIHVSESGSATAGDPVIP